MTIRTFAVITISLLLPVTVFTASSCPPPGYTTGQLLQLRQQGFEIEDTGQKNALALGLLGCVGEPDPAIRDGVAFEGITKWLRAGEISAETLDVLFAGLVGHIRNTDDPNGFQQPFAALILSEVMRTDRIDGTLSDSQREEVVVVASGYLRDLHDYRGFSETEGWRHGVAHGSDLVLQLVLNPKITANRIMSLMEAISIQVSPPGEVFYVYGEPGRLARAVFYAYMQAQAELSAWQAWFDKLSSPMPFASWSETYSSQAGLAKRHNTLAFLQALHFNAVTNGGDAAPGLAEIVQETIARVIGG